jgi:hypothetical protein
LNLNPEEEAKGDIFTNGYSPDIICRIRIEDLKPVNRLKILV